MQKIWIQLPDTRFFSGSIGNSYVVDGDALFSGTGSGNFGEVTGEATFNAAATQGNQGVIGGGAIFNWPSIPYNSGTITDADGVEFNDYPDYTFVGAFGSGCDVVPNNQLSDGGCFANGDFPQSGSDDIYFVASSYITTEGAGAATYQSATFLGDASWGTESFIHGNIEADDVSFEGSGINYANIVGDSTTFNESSSNNGTVTGTTTFNNSSFNAGTVTGTTTFNNDSANYGFITGATITFNNSGTIDGGEITGAVIFNGNSSEFLSGTITGTKTRHYSADVTPARNFSGWIVQSDTAPTVVTLTDPGTSWDETTSFETIAGGTFVGGPARYWNTVNIGNAWTTLANWYTDENLTSPAVDELPTADDPVVTVGDPGTGPTAVVDGTGFVDGTPFSLDVSATGITFTAVAGGYPGINITGNNLTTTSPVTFNSTSENMDTITGYTVFNSTFNSNTITGDVVFNGTGGNVGSITGNTTFNNQSYNGEGGAITGKAIYGFTTLNNGTITFGEDMRWGAGTASDGNFNADEVTPLTRWIFNNNSFNEGAITGTAKFNTTYYHGTDVPTNEILTVNAAKTWAGSVSGAVTNSEDEPITTWHFNGTGNNTGTVPGDAIFYGDDSEDSGTITGDKTRYYTATATITRDLTGWIVIADGDDIIVTLDCSTNSDDALDLIAINGADFDFETGCGGGGAHPEIDEFSASDTSIISGESVTLTWATTDLTSCTGTGGTFAGSKAVDGSEVVSPTSDTTYGLSCSRGQVDEEADPISITVTPAVNGCTDNTAFNYDPLANVNEGCVAVVLGCTDADANNYNALANTDDSSCTYPAEAAGGGGGSNPLVILEKRLKNLFLNPLPIVPIFNNNTVNPGTTSLGNPLSGLTPLGTLALPDIHFNFPFNFDFLFAPLPTSITDSLKGAEGLQNLLSAAGLANTQDLAALSRNPLQLPTPITPVRGLYMVKGGAGNSIRTFVTSDTEHPLLQMVRTSPGALLSISLIPLHPAPVQAIFEDKIITFDAGSGSYVTTSLIAPSTPGRYLFISDAAPMPLAIDVVAPPPPKPKTVPIISRFFNWLFSWF